MVQVKIFEFNPFSENTYIVYDDSRECVVFDPGCYFPEEEAALAKFIKAENLRPVRLINTHCHIDHVFGNRFVAETWGLPLECHRGELPVLERLLDVARMYGIPNVEASPAPAKFIEDEEVITFGQSQCRAIFAPGHSPASLCFYFENDGILIGGDVLFFESIGRSDLPGGDLETLLTSIRTRLFTLPEATVVFPGHGPGTTIRHEKENNPFL